MDNKKLLFILIGLVVLYAASRFLTSDSRERSFRSTLVEIDTADVSAVTLYLKEERDLPIRFTRTDNGWMVKQGNVEGEANVQSVRVMLGQLLDIIPQRLASRNPDTWAEYQVNDSLATRIQVEEDGETTLDLMIGAFNFNQATRSATSYVRLRDEDETYVSDGLLTMNFNRPFNNWRNSTFVRLTPADVTRLAFTYPDNAGFELTRPDSAWLIDGTPADSAGTAGYLNRLRNLTNTEFVEQIDVVPSNPDYQLRIEGINMTPIVVEAFKGALVDGNFLLHSSLNPNVYFSSDSTGVWGTVFREKDLFLE